MRIRHRWERGVRSIKKVLRGSMRNSCERAMNKTVIAEKDKEVKKKKAMGSAPTTKKKVRASIPTSQGLWRSVKWDRMR